MNKKIFLAAVAVFLGAGVVMGQNQKSAKGKSDDFKYGQWIEINNGILRELKDNYVDSLPLGRIERAGIDAMLENLDPYTVYIPEEENADLQMMINKTYGGIGAVIWKPSKDSLLVINEPYAGSPAAKAGLVCGDEVLEIEGQTVIGLTAAECSDKMKGKPGTSLKMKIRRVRGGQVEDVTITRQRIHLPDVEYAGMLNDTTGYILQTGFTENVSQDVRNAFLRLKDQGMKKLVLDLRSNGGGLLSEAVKIVSLFVPKGSLVVSQKGNSPESYSELRTQTEPLDLNIPIVVLVDGGTASSSEIVSGALQDMDRATIMGTRTFGKGLVQSIRPLPYNGQLKVTVAKYYTPSGRCVQAIDYAHRNEDGSVQQIPDSLTHEFRTAHGRIVRDGGGITPDVTLDTHSYSRLTYSLVMNGIIEQYAMKYVRNHESIPPVDEFHFTDYDDFVAFAKDKDFDYRSSAMAMFDSMKKELEKDGLAEGAKDELDALSKAIDLDKETFLRKMQSEITPFIEEEIVVRYYFQEAGVKVRLRYDDELKEALTKPLIKI
jgi:carboxyl-terminal processing protease